MRSTMVLTAVGVCISLAVLTGCATTGRDSQSPQKSNLTMGVVKTEVIKGETTQAEILQLFGAPNLVTKNRSEEEVWNYNRMSFESVRGSDSGFAIFWSGSRAVSSTTTNSFDLIITFDENDVVKDYSVISASY